MKTNGIAEGTGLRAGQKIVIPTYVYNSKAPVSAPDHNPKVADAKSSHGNKSDTPAKLPAPADAPSDKVAVLPKSPKLKEGETQPPAEATSAKGDRVASSKGGSYTVASGDTLSKIAKKNGVSVVALKKANGLNDGLLKVGQALKIPAGGGEQVASAAKPGVDPIVTGAAGPSKKAAAEQVAGYTPPKKADKVIADAEDEDASAAPGGTGIGKMRWPVRGRVISNYGSGSGKSNDGIDISVPEGTPVKAAENGVVIYAGDGLKDFGNTVLVRHENGLVTVYGHASSLEVKRGEKVKRGQEIARSGMSGTTDAPKLHFEVRKDSATGRSLDLPRVVEPTRLRTIRLVATSGGPYAFQACAEIDRLVRRRQYRRGLGSDRFHAQSCALADDRLLAGDERSSPRPACCFSSLRSRSMRRASSTSCSKSRGRISSRIASTRRSTRSAPGCAPPRSDTSILPAATAPSRSASARLPMSQSAKAALADLLLPTTPPPDAATSMTDWAITVLADWFSPAPPAASIIELSMEEPEPGLLKFSLTDAGIDFRLDRAVKSSIAVISHRIDELDLGEPVIERQGADRFLVKVSDVQRPDSG